MGKAEYWQRGETLDYKNTGTATIEANTVVIFGNRIGVAGTDILPGEVGSLHVTGVFEMTKTASGAIEMGTDVYFDGSGITNTEGDDTVPAGYAAQAAAAGDTVILVKLTG
jgi:predicted RecA/RadA family phage recombinase